MYETTERIEGIEIAEHALQAPPLDLHTYKLSMNVIMMTAALAGMWGTTCIISGLMSSSSLHELGRGLATALLGI